MTQLKALVFDMGGVLLRSMDWGPRDAQAKRLGISRLEMENEVFGNRTAALATVGACSEAEHWKTVGRKFGIPEEAMPAWRREFWSGDRMDRDLLGWLGSQRPQYKTAMLSNAWPEARISVGENYPGSFKVFDLVIFSAEVQLAKPDERIYRLVCQRLGVAPEEAVFVDDVAENIAGARRIGMQGVQFLEPQQAIRDVTALMNGNTPV